MKDATAILTGATMTGAAGQVIAEAVQRKADLETLTKAFAEAASSLSVAMVADLTTRDPELAAKVAGAVQAGERLEIALAADLSGATITMATTDDYGTRRQVMHIAARTPTRN